MGGGRAILSVLLFLGIDAGATEPGWPQPVDDNPVVGLLLADQLELRNSDAPDLLRWDVQGWIGTDYHKLWVKTEGEDRRPSPGGGEAELQVLYSRLIAPFWDLQAGLRYDRLYGEGPDRDRSFAVLGLEGLAPYRFELEPALFLSAAGDLSARLTATYDLLFTQRLILQPRFETNLAAQQVSRHGVGRGLDDLELGLRLRYELRRELAPYVGVNWLRRFGDSADLARAEGEQVTDLSILAGVRVWF